MFKICFLIVCLETNVPLILESLLLLMDFAVLYQHEVVQVRHEIDLGFLLLMAAGVC